MNSIRSVPSAASRFRDWRGDRVRTYRFERCGDQPDEWRPSDQIGTHRPGITGADTDPDPTPTPTPTPTPNSPFARRIDQPNNDMAYNATDGKFSTVPGAVKDGTGNTITRIDLATRQIVRQRSSEASRQDSLCPRTIRCCTRISPERATSSGCSIPQLRRRAFNIRCHMLPTVTVRSSTIWRRCPARRNAGLVRSAGSFGAAVYDNGVQRPNTTLASHPRVFIHARIALRLERKHAFAAHGQCRRIDPAQFAWQSDRPGPYICRR